VGSAARGRGAAGARALVCAALALAGLPCSAQTCRPLAAADPGGAGATAPAATEQLPDALRRLVGELEREYREGRFAAAVFTYVRPAAIVACTFGAADGRRTRPVDAARTRFYIGSITKTFTGLAIAQLVRAGRIRSVEDPVNLYLKRLQLEDAAGRAVTVRHLLTHTGGFEDRAGDVATDRPIPTPVSAQEIARIRPRQLREPGFGTAYSNFGTALLGVLLEDVTGKSARDYFREHIWVPLGMTATDFATGLEAAPDAVQAETVAGGAPRPVDYLAFHPLYWPVGAILATPFDMGRYVQAQLLESGPPGAAGLGSDVYALAHERLYANHPDVNGFAMQIMTGRWNGDRLWTHGGAWPWYNSMMVVLPDRQAGYFASIASRAQSPNPLEIIELSERLTAAIAGPRVIAGERAVAAGDLAEYPGIYLTQKRNASRPEAVLRFLGADAGITQVSVSADHQGLIVDGRGPYVPAGADLFVYPGFRFDPQDPFASFEVGFMRSASGRVVALTSGWGLWSSNRIDALEDPRWLRRATLWTLPLLALGLLLPLWFRADPRGRRVHAVLALQPVLVGTLLGLLLIGYDAGGLNYYLLRGHTSRFTLMTLAGTLIVLLGALNAGDLWRRLYRGPAPPPRWRALWIGHRATVLAGSVAIGWLLIRTHLAFG
jgi:CubicO group peptidase (beta-lactamase class C family)